MGKISSPYRNTRYLLHEINQHVFFYLEVFSLYTTSATESQTLYRLFSLILSVLSAILLLSDDERQSNSVASTPKAPSKRNTVCHIFLLFFFTRIAPHSIFINFFFFFWHYLAVSCSRCLNLLRHHAEMNYRGTYYQRFVLEGV